jgi:hypothetical protein
MGLLQLLEGQAQEAPVTYQSMSFPAYRDTGVAQAQHTLGARLFEPIRSKETRLRQRRAQFAIVEDGAKAQICGKAG